MNNLTELSKKVYQLQIEKGWCKLDEKRDVETLKILILSEAFEAFEAYRKGNYAQLHISKLEVLKKYLDNYPNLKSTQDNFKEFVKDTFQDEIADVAIRALDLAGYLGLGLLDFGLSTYIEDSYNYAQHLGNLVDIINYERGKEVRGLFLSLILEWCWSISNIFRFDLMQHIELKLAYNKTRPFRHGNKVV